MEENVWSCILAYRIDAAKELLTKFGSKAAILKALVNYSNKGSYHGHQSGATGGAENPGAAENLGQAIAHLRNAKAPDQGPKTTGPNKALKRANEMKSAGLLGVIDETMNKPHYTLDEIRVALAKENPDWENVKDVWNKYSFVYKDKKGKLPTKSS